MSSGLGRALGLSHTRRTGIPSWYNMTRPGVWMIKSGVFVPLMKRGMPGGRHPRIGSSVRWPAAASATRFFQVAANGAFRGGGQGSHPSLLLDADPPLSAASTRTHTPLRSGAFGSPYQLSFCGAACVCAKAEPPKAGKAIANAITASAARLGRERTFFLQQIIIFIPSALNPAETNFPVTQRLKRAALEPALHRS